MFQRQVCRLGKQWRIARPVVDRAAENIRVATHPTICLYSRLRANLSQRQHMKQLAQCDIPFNIFLIPERHMLIVCQMRNTFSTNPHPERFPRREKRVEVDLHTGRQSPKHF